MIVVNLFGGPGIGKSTLSAELFCLLKKLGLEAAQVGEYVKDCIQAGRLEELDNELYIFAEQARRLRRLDSVDCDVAICDWPLLMAVVYNSMNFPGEPESFPDVVFEEFIQYDNLNFQIMRTLPMEQYSMTGRVHGPVDALIIDGKINTMLKKTCTANTTINIANSTLAVEIIKRKLAKGGDDD